MVTNNTKYLCQRPGRAGWYVRYPIPRQYRSLLKRACIERKAGESLAEAKRNQFLILHEIDQEVLQSVGELDAVDSLVNNIRRFGGSEVEAIELQPDGTEETIKLGADEVLQWTTDPSKQRTKDQSQALEIVTAGGKKILDVMEERRLVEHPQPRTYRNWTNGVQQFLETTNVQYMHNISKQHAVHYKNSLLKRGLEGSTVKNYLTVLKALWNYGVDHGYATSNPFDGLTKKLQGSKKKPLPDQQLMTRADAIAWKSVDLRYMIMKYTGCRASECNGLRYQDLQEEMVSFVEWETDAQVRHLKGRESDERKVPMHPELLRFIDTNNIDLNQTGPIWPTAYKKSEQSWGAGWAGSFKEKFAFTSHDLRRIAVTQLNLAGVSPFILYAITRHTIPGMSAVVDQYTRPKPADLLAAISIIN